MKVIGHRGAASLAPENTFAGFDIARSLGVDAVETDVQQTLDGKLVLFHDDSLRRVAGIDAKVQELTWEELRQIDIGSSFNPAYADQRVPLLTDFLDRYGDLAIDLEIKQPGIADEVTKMVDGSGHRENITYTSFDFDTVARAKILSPDIRAGLLTTDISDEMIARVKGAGLEQYCPIARLVTPELVTKWKQKDGLYVRAWGVDNGMVMQQAVKAGVDGMTVDFPHLLLDEIGRGEQAREVVADLRSRGLSKTETHTGGERE